MAKHEELEFLTVGEACRSSDILTYSKLTSKKIALHSQRSDILTYCKLASEKIALHSQ